MSSISFVSPSGEIRISGAERAMMSAICDGFRRMQMGKLEYDDLDWVERVTVPGHYLNDYAARLRLATTTDERVKLRLQLARAFDTFFAVGDEKSIILDGEPVDVFCLSLNSAIAWGNRPVQLCAKLHGQCEIHAYCEGEDRAWLADLVQEALDCGVFRSWVNGYDGWQKLMDFLRSSDSEPVVTSYSVTDSFPNPNFAPEGVISADSDDPWEEWSKFDAAKQWEWGMNKLREEPSLRISPDRLGRLFDIGLTATEFMRRAREVSIAPAEAA
jgi:hypothetical protein